MCVVAIMIGGAIESVVPSAGPLAGGNLLTITGSAEIGSGSDITAVTLGDVAAVIQSQTHDQVVVLVPPGAALAPGRVRVTVTSTTVGVSSLANGYTFHPGTFYCGWW